MLAKLLFFHTKNLGKGRYLSEMARAIIMTAPYHFTEIQSNPVIRISKAYDSLSRFASSYTTPEIGGMNLPV